MPALKITPEIERFIFDNRYITGSALHGLVESRFNIKLTQRSVEQHRQKARLEVEGTNEAKVEAVRSKVLDDADKFATKYLKYLDDEIETLHKILEEHKTLEVTTIRDRILVSQALNKYLTTIIEFAKPTPTNDLDITLNWGDNEIKPASPPPAEADS